MENEKREGFLKYLVAGGVHDSNNLLQPVYWALALCMQALHGSKEREIAAIQAAEHSLAQVTRIWQNVIAELKGVERKNAFELHRILKDVSDLFKGLLSFTISNEAPLLIGNDVFLRQILTNLVGNAAKYIPKEEGEITINVEIAEKTEEGCLLRFQVIDNGSGIPSEKIGNIFEENFQCDREHGGIGIGLFFSRLLVEMMGGEISVESEEGVGTTFTFTAQFETDPAAAIKVSSVPPPPANDIHSAHIIVVDDEKTARILVANALRQRGFCNITTVESAPKALEIMQRGAVRLVISDCHMPEMDGPEMVGKMVEMGLNIPVITVSGSPPEESHGSGIHLQKPVHPETLLKAVKKLLSSSV